jgi:hypothetical protein
MGKDDLHNMFHRATTRALEADEAAMTCRVIDTANSVDDDVSVVLLNSANPHLAFEVNWRPSVQVVDGKVQPRYPEEDDEGIVIEDDTGELWLIW